MARRFGSVGLGVVVALVAAMGPLVSDAAAASPWSREVRMQPQPGPVLIFEYDAGVDPTCTLAGTWQTDGGHCKSLGSSTDSVSASIGTEIGEPSATGSPEPIANGHDYEIVITCYRVAPSGAGNVHFRWMNAAGTSSGDIQIGAANACPNTGSGTITTTHTAFHGSVSNINRMQIRGDFSMHITYLRIRDLDVERAGTVDCKGVAGAGGDAGLVIPNWGLRIMSDHDEWGDVPMNDPDLGGYGGCLFNSTGSYRYTPPEGITAGETHVIGVQVSTHVARNSCRVVIMWGGEATKSIMVFEYAGEDLGAAGPGANSVHSDAPAGASYFSIYFADGCVLHGLHLQNAEGDPIIDNGSDGTDGNGGQNPGPDTGGNPWANCQPGQDFLAVGEWVAYAACLIAGLPIAVASAFMSLLYTLFVPSQLGTRWSSLMLVLEDRVPFGFVSQVVGFLTNGLTASNLAGPGLVFSFEVMDAPVAFNGGVISNAVSPYRPALVGVVWLTLAWGLFGKVGGALGMGRTTEAPA